MSKKTARISVNKLESLVVDNVVNIPLDGYPDVNITISRTLSLQEVLQFVEDVVSSCVDMETGRYTPEIYAFSLRASVLTRYANFTLPKDLDKQYNLIYNTTVFQQILDHIDLGQYNEIVNAINERIRHEVVMMESTLAGQMAELTEKINTFIDGSEKLFGSIDTEDMSTLMKNLSKAGNVDEGKIVDAVFNAQKREKAGIEPESTIVPDGNVIAIRKKKS